MLTFLALGTNCHGDFYLMVQITSISGEFQPEIYILQYLSPSQVIYRDEFMIHEYMYTNIYKQKIYKYIGGFT